MYSKILKIDKTISAFWMEMFHLIEKFFYAHLKKKKFKKYRIDGALYGKIKKIVKSSI